MPLSSTNASKSFAMGNTVSLRSAVGHMQAFGKAPYVAFFSDAALEREITAANFEIVERARHRSRGKDSRPFLVTRKRPA